MQNSLFVKKNSILLSLTLAIGIGSNAINAAPDGGAIAAPAAVVAPAVAPVAAAPAAAVIAVAAPAAADGVVRAPRSFFQKSILVAGVAAVIRAATKDAEKAPYSVYDASSVANDVKELLAAKEYKAAAFVMVKFFDDAIIGFVGKPAGISVAGSSLAIKGEDVEAGSLIKDATEYHLLKKEAVKPYGVVGCVWAKFKGMLEAMEAITKAQKTVDDFGKLLA